jgi:hypothetical protein
VRRFAFALSLTFFAHTAFPLPPPVTLSREPLNRIICLTLALFPCLLLAALLETWFSSRPFSSPFSAPPVLSPDEGVNLSTAEPTMLAESKSKALTSGTEQKRLREKRRKGFEADGEVV